MGLSHRPSAANERRGRPSSRHIGEVLAASDFLTVEVWTGRGLVTHYLLFMISLPDRVVNSAGITTRPDESWMLQIARNVTDSQAGALHAKRYLIIDRDTKYSEQFRRLIRDAGTNVICLPQRSPNLNAHAERFVRSIKDECLNRMIFIGQASLRRAVAEYTDHYHRERNHQGLENRLIHGPRSWLQMRAQSIPTRGSLEYSTSTTASGVSSVDRIFGCYGRRILCVWLRPKASVSGLTNCRQQARMAMLRRMSVFFTLPQPLVRS